MNRETPRRLDAQTPTSRHGLRSSASIRLALSIIALALAWLLLGLRVDPVPTWFYVFAWYPTLMLLDAVASLLDGRASLLFDSGKVTLSLLAWSPIVWLVFEAANFRVRNWYYVFLPASQVERWAGILLSFATVLPAIVLAERVLAAGGAFGARQHRPVPIRRWMLHASMNIALLATALVALFPTYCFPLLWGIGLFWLEPFVYRRAPHLSLFRDLERGEWGRIARLLLGGVGIGFLWESYNHFAQGSWIYTVPGLEHIKLFEMPPLGFLGFPVFALEAWVMYSSLCIVRVAVPVVGTQSIARVRSIVAGAFAVAFAIAVLVGMEHFTISSTVPRLGDLPGLRPATVAALERGGVGTPRALASAAPARVAAITGSTDEEAEAVVQTARLAMLRGIGAVYVSALAPLGVRSVCDLPGQDANTLSAGVRSATGGVRPSAAEVRVWIRAAEGACRSLPPSHEE
jgi:hypothetical protein